MRIITFIFFVFGLTSVSFAQQPIHAIKIKNINEDIIDLNSFKGKKILVAIIPTHSSDSGYFLKLCELQKLYSKKVKIIAIPSFDDDYNDSRDKKNLKQAFQNDSSVLITTGMYIKKSDGSRQDALMQWLTDKSKNGHLDIDAKGINQKYFINETGDLYGVFGPEISLSVRLMQKMLR